MRRPNRIKDITGIRSGRLTALFLSKMNPHGHATWFCICECGGEKEIPGYSLRQKHTKSCGCLSSEQAGRRFFKHGKSFSKIHGIWIGMRQRCTNKKTKWYKNYGARGIKVCKRWNEFNKFYSDMGDCPDGLSLDRINNNGDYKPSNCRWATRSQQAENRRLKKTSVYIKIGRETNTTRQWEKIMGLNKDTVGNRIRLGWSKEDAVFTPLRSNSKISSSSPQSAVIRKIRIHVSRTR